MGRERLQEAQEREQNQRALAKERAEKEALLREKLQADEAHAVEVQNLQKLLEEKGENNDSKEAEDLREKLFNSEMQVTTALSQASEAETAAKDSQARLSEALERETSLKEELAKLRAEDKQIRKEEKARDAEKQSELERMHKELDKLNFAEKRSHM